MFVQPKQVVPSTAYPGWAHGLAQKWRLASLDWIENFHLAVVQSNRMFERTSRILSRDPSILLKVGVLFDAGVFIQVSKLWQRACYINAMVLLCESPQRPALWGLDDAHGQLEPQKVARLMEAAIW
jgi:hypothetical protein